MSDPSQLSERDPRRHAIRLRRMLADAADHAREDLRKIEDAKGQALFETTAEVLGGLITAFEHFEQRSEAAWR